MKKLGMIALCALLMLFVGCAAGQEELQPQPSEEPDEPLREEEIAYDSIEVLSAAVGVEFTLPEAVPGYELARLFSYSDRIAAAEYESTEGTEGNVYYHASANEDVHKLRPDDYDSEAAVWSSEYYFGAPWYDSTEPLDVSTGLYVVNHGEKRDEYGALYDDWEHYIRIANWQEGGVFCQLEWSPGVPIEAGREVMRAFTAHLEPAKWDPSQIDGDRLHIELRENQTTGLFWAYRMLGDCMELEGDEYEQDEADDNMAGVGGTHYWTFRAVAPGEAELRLRLANNGAEDLSDAQWVIRYKVNDDLTIEPLGVE